MYLPPKTMPEIPVQYGVQRQALRDGPKKGFDLNTKLDPTETLTPPPPPPPPPATHPHPSATRIDQNEEKKSLDTGNTNKNLDKVKVRRKGETLQPIINLNTF